MEPASAPGPEISSDIPPAISIDIHPAVVELAAGPGVQPIAYADRARDGALQALAVLAPHTIQPLRQSRLGWLGALRGLRLIGNGLAGRRDIATLSRFVDAATDLLGNGDAECIYFEDVDVGSPLWRALSEPRAGRARIAYPRPPQPRWRIRFPAPPDTYWHQFSSKTRNTMRRAVKRLEHTVEAVTEPAQVAHFLASAQRISARSWQGKRMGQRMENEPHQRAHLEALARLGALRSYVLHHQDAPAAFLYGWQWNGLYCYEETGYDLALAEKGPGKILLHRVLEDLIARDCPAVLDFGTGDADYKRRLGNDQTSSGPILMLPLNARAWMYTAVHQLRDMADQGARQLLHITGLYQHARRLYRR